MGNYDWIIKAARKPKQHLADDFALIEIEDEEITLLAGMRKGRKKFYTFFDHDRMVELRGACDEYFKRKEAGGA